MRAFYYPVLFLLLSFVTKAHAQTWTGGGTSSNWSDPGNWLGGVPVSGQNTSIVFGGINRLGPIQNIASPFVLTSMTFTNTAGAFILGGNSLRFVSDSGGFTPSITNNSSSIININESIDIMSSTLRVGGTGNTFLAGPISGSGGLTKNDAGTLTLVASNTFTGNVAVNSGTVVAANINSFGSASKTINIANGAAVRFSITQDSPTVQTFVLNGTGNSAGALQCNTSTFFALTGATIVLNASSNIGGATQFNIGNGPNTATIAGGNFTLTKVGNNLLALDTNNVTLGSLVVNQGTVFGQQDFALGRTPGGAPTPVNVMNGASLGLWGAATTVANPVTLNGTIGTNGALASFDGPSNRTYTGQVTLAATSGIGGNTNMYMTGPIIGPGGLVKLGTNHVIISGSNTFSGQVVINSGVLWGDVIANGGQSSSFGNSPASTPIVIGANSENALFGYYGTSASSNRTFSLTSGGFRGISSFYAGSNLTLSGLISGSGSFYKSGDGELTLLSNNTFTSNPLIDVGTLTVPSVTNAGIASPLGTGSGIAIQNNATLRYTGSLGFTNRTTLLPSGVATIDLPGSSNLTLFGNISGAGGINKSGTGTLVLGTSNTYTGPTSITGGNLYLAVDNAIPSSSAVTVNNATQINMLDPVSSNNTNQVFGSLAGAAGIVYLGVSNSSPTTLTVGGNNSSTSFAGAITGNGSLVKTGTGTMTLGSLNSHTGMTTVQGNGTLRLAVHDALAVSGNVTVNSARLELAPGVFQAIEDLTIGQSGNNPADVTTGGGGSLLQWRGDMYFNGTGAGTGISTIAGMVELSSGSHFLFGNASSNTFDLHLAADLVGAGGLVKFDSHRLQLSGNNSFTGALDIRGGTVYAGSLGAIPFNSHVALSPGTFLDNRHFINGGQGFGQTFGSLSGGGIVNIAPGTTIATGGDNTSSSFTGVIQGGGAFAKNGSGTMQLSGNNSHQGGTYVNGGELVANHNNALGLGFAVVNNTGTLRIAESRTVNNPVTVNTGGMFCVDGTYTGTLTLNGGTLCGEGVLSSLVTTGVNDSIAPGHSPGILTLSSLNMSSGGTLAIELAGILVGSQYDRLIVTGSAFLGNGIAELNVVKLDGFISIPGEQFIIMERGIGSLGIFANLPDNSDFTVGNNVFRINYSAGDGNDIALTTMSVVPEPTTITLTLLSVSILGWYRLRATSTKKEQEESEVAEAT